MRAAEHPARRFWWLPASRVGRWAVALFGVACAAVVELGLVATVQERSGPLGHDLLLAVPAMLAAACGLTSLVLGGYAIARHERALLLLLSTAAGLNILSYVIGEAMRQP